MEIISKAMSLRLLFSSLLLTCCMMAVSAQSTQPNDEIWYTSTDSKPVEPFNKFAFGATLKSNTYNDGKGIITFDDSISSIGLKAFYRCTRLTSIRLPESVASIGDRAFVFTVLRNQMKGKCFGDSLSVPGLFQDCLFKRISNNL